MGKDNNSNKKNIDEYSEREIFNVAHSFLLAAYRCNEQIIKQGHIQWLFIPTITNAAFSCELFIKTILKKRNLLEKKDRHALEILFYKLPEEIREKVYVQMQFEGFEAQLKNISFVFQEWRYIYEMKTNFININFLLAFMNSLYDVAKDEL